MGRRRMAARQRDRREGAAPDPYQRPRFWRYVFPCAAWDIVADGHEALHRMRLALGLTKRQSDAVVLLLLVALGGATLLGLAHGVAAGVWLVERPLAVGAGLILATRPLATLVRVARGEGTGRGGPFTVVEPRRDGQPWRVVDRRTAAASGPVRGRATGPAYATAMEADRVVAWMNRAVRGAEAERQPAPRVPVPGQRQPAAQGGDRDR